MADSVDTRIITDNERNLVMQFTSVSDGTGETNVVKVDVSTLSANSRGQACTEVSIEKIAYTCSNFIVIMQWDATTPVVAAIIGGSGANSVDSSIRDWSDAGGIHNNSGTGKTGDLTFTTLGQTLNDVYDITLYMKKSYG